MHSDDVSSLCGITALHCGLKKLSDSEHWPHTSHPRAFRVKQQNVVVCQLHVFRLLYIARVPLGLTTLQRELLNILLH